MEGVRAPRQQRGKASFERLLDVAEGLLAEEGYGGLTIAALREHGISNGSIYWRVDSIDSLYVAVHERFLRRVAADHRPYEDSARWDGLSLSDFVCEAVRVEATVFERHGKLLRALVLHEGADLASSQRGTEAVRRAARRFVERVAPRLERECVPRPEVVATVIFRAVFSSLLARTTWPEQQEEAGAQLAWDEYVDELCRMATRYASPS